jgi:RNA polymerase sigma factor (sigma-70 family)
MTTMEFSYQLLNLKDNLSNFALRLTLNREDARDLTQETLLKAYTNRTRFENCSNMRAWTFTIMKNIFINNYRRNIRRQAIFDNTSDLFSHTKNQYIDNILPDSFYSTIELNQIINRLKYEFKAPFKMHLDGYKYKEIAENLKLNIGTVKSRIFFARKTLMKMIGDVNM